MGNQDIDALLEELRRQRRDLEVQLDDTQRSSRSTSELVEKIAALKRRSEEFASKRTPAK